jgi:hypothetical protein
MGQPENIITLRALGRTAAGRQVKPEHFLRLFDLRS